MTDAVDVLSKARLLGEALAAHPRVQAMHAAQRSVHADQAAQALLKQYQEHAAAIRRREAEGKPIEPADKRKLAELESGMAGNEALKRMMRAQADYLDLMNQVHETMDGALASKLQADAKS
jgi:cell fate (sporulation/competence/biofilm development) regulator YlbF (YheA/YmcA/DUF963 family)